MSEEFTRDRLRGIAEKVGIPHRGEFNSGLTWLASPESTLLLADMTVQIGRCGLGARIGLSFLTVGMCGRSSNSGRDIINPVSILGHAEEAEPCTLPAVLAWAEIHALPPARSLLWIPPANPSGVWQKMMYLRGSEEEDVKAVQIAQEACTGRKGSFSGNSCPQVPAEGRVWAGQARAGGVG